MKYTKQTMSEQGRASIASAQKARWARFHAAKEAAAAPPQKQKRTLSAAGRAAIAAGRRARAERERAAKSGIIPLVLAADIAPENGREFPSADALRRAIVIAEEIVSLQDQLRALLRPTNTI